MKTREEVERHLEELRAQERKYLDAVLVVRGAMRACEYVLGPGGPDEVPEAAASEGDRG